MSKIRKNPPKVRKTWGELNPVTRVKQSAKNYKRWTAREAALNRYLQDNDQ